MLKAKLQQEMIHALKSKNSKRLEILRFMLAQINNREIEKQGDLTDEEVQAVLRKLAKELKESIVAFEKGQRNELAQSSKDQLLIVQSYLPQEMSDEDLKKAIDEIVKNHKDIYDQNAKAIIGMAMKELKTKAAPERIMKALQSYLH